MTAPRTVQWHTARHLHPVYRQQLAAVPDGFRYVHTHPGFDDVQAATKRVAAFGSGLSGRTNEGIEAAGAWTLGKAGYIHTTRAAHVEGADLIHSAVRLLLRPRIPYVVDVEHIDGLVLFQPQAYRRPWNLPVLERMLLDERLRFILPWSDAARRSILARVRPEAAARLEPKLRTVYPAAIHQVERPAVSTEGPLRALFIGTMFHEKGGVDAVRAVRDARAEGFDVELDIVTFAPPKWQRTLQDEAGMTLHAPAGQDLVRRLYEQSDVLLFPSHMDTYGVVVGEAMGYGLPVLAPNHLALQEMVEHGVNGLSFPAENMLWDRDTFCVVPHVVPTPRSYLKNLQEPSEAYVRGIAEALGRLASDRVLLQQLAQGALDTVAQGRLSVSERRGRLASVYADALS